MNLQSLTVPLLLDTSKFDAGIDGAKNKSNSLVGGLAKVGGGVVMGGLALAASGFAAMSAGIIKSVIGASEAESIQAQLNAVLESTGGIAGISAERVNALATSLSTMTQFEDDAIVSGQNMLLTFTNIGADGGIFDQTTGIMLDMSQAMGQDLSSTAIQLGKALNNPTEGLTSLTRVGVAFTDEQKNMIQALQESGDMAGAQQIILNELKTEFGGSAEAAGKTFAGALAISKNAIGNVFETIGGKLLPVLTSSGKKFSTWINAPETQAKIQKIGDAVANFVGKVVEFIPKAITTFQNIATWMQNNQPIIIGILVALGVAVGIWAVQTAIAGWAAMVPFLPIIAILLAIAAVVALFAAAWKSDFGGIKTKTQAAFSAIAGYWNGTLKPAFQAIGAFISTYIMPIFAAMGNFIKAVLGVAFAVIGGIIRTVFLPPLQQVGAFLGDKLLPVVTKVAGWISGKLAGAFSGLKTILGQVAAFIQRVADALSKLKLPKNFTPGSPFPFTDALVGMNKELQKSANAILPKFSAELSFAGNVPAISSTATNNNSELITAIKGISKDPLDYERLARVIRDTVLKEMR